MTKRMALLLACLVLLVCGSVWSLTSCSEEANVELGVAVNGQVMDVIDMHLHPGEWELIPPETRKFLASRFPFPFKLNPEDLAQSVLTAQGILAELNKAHIRGGVLFAVYAPKTVGICTNEYVISQVAEKPDRLFGLASLRVDRWNKDKDAQLTAFEKALKSPGMVGVKLAHAHMHFRMDDPRYYDIYKVAGRLKKPIYLHTGSSPFPNISQKEAYTNPAYLEDAIKKHPDTIFILGHLGYDFIGKKHMHLDVCIKLAKQYKNVFLEPSAFGSASGDPDGSRLAFAMKQIKENGLVDRVIYGSDGPQSPGFVKDYLERTIKAMKASQYTNKEMQDVLGANFIRVFGIKQETKKP